MKPVEFRENPCVAAIRKMLQDAADSDEDMRGAALIVVQRGGNAATTEYVAGPGAWLELSGACAVLMQRIINECSTEGED